MSKKISINVYDVNKKPENCNNINDVLSNDELINIEKVAISISKNWWKSETNLILEEDNIYYGSLLQIKVFFLIKKITRLSKVLDKIKSEINISVEDYSEYLLLKKISKLENLDVHIKYFGKRFNNNSIKSIIKDLGFENLLKFISEIRIINKCKCETQENVLIQEINNNSMINLIETVEKRTENMKFTTICFGRNLYKIALNEKKIMSSNYLYLKLIYGLRKKYINYFKKDKINLFLQKRFKSYDLNYNLYKRDFERMVINELTGVCLYKKSIEDLFRNKNIRRVVLSSDSHTLSRLVCQLSKKYDIKTFVFQHGSIGELAFTPLYADKFLAWGSHAKEYMIMKNEDEIKIDIVGNIKYCADTYKNSDICLRKKTNSNILWAVNPIGNEINIRLFSILENFIKETKNVNLTIKLHPGQSDEELFKNIRSKSIVKDKITILTKQSNIIEAIRDNDIVVITQSSTGLEAMMLNKLVFSYEEKGISDTIPYIKFNSVLSFRNSKELINKFNNISLEDIKKMRENSKKFLAYYMQYYNEKKLKEIFEENK